MQMFGLIWLVCILNLKLTKDLDEYMENFDNLVAKAGLNDAQSIICFLGGLKSSIREICEALKSSFFEWSHAFSSFIGRYLIRYDKKT